MCDYSLLSFRNRLAIEGEQLLTYRFPSFSIGLASPAEIKAEAFAQQEGGSSGSWWSRIKDWLFQPELCSKEVAAVCIPPGARLRVVGVPASMQEEFGIGSVEDVKLIELSASAYEYRDAIQFTNGRRALLQDLHEGVRFEVLSLGMMEPELEREEVRIRWS
jgi:hypothetical protein